MKNENSIRQELLKLLTLVLLWKPVCNFFGITNPEAQQK